MFWERQEPARVEGRGRRRRRRRGRERKEEGMMSMLGVFWGLRGEEAGVGRCKRFAAF